MAHPSDPLPPHWTLRRVLSRAAQVLVTDGPKSLYFKVLGEIAYRRVYLYTRPLDLTPLTTPVDVSVTLGALSVADVPDYLALRPDSDPTDIQRRLIDGQRCFVARRHGQLAHAAWASTGRIYIAYLQRHITLAPDEVYSYESFTHPAERGHNLAAQRSAYQQAALRQAGYRRMLAVAVPDNKPALRALEKAGFVRVGTLRTIWLGRWRRHFGGPPAPRSISATYWDEVAHQVAARPHYLDPFLGQIKRQAHLDLIARWGGLPDNGRVLKTDVFEEALGPDAFLSNLGGGGRQVVGMDISPALAARARHTDRAGVGRYVVADVRHLPFADRAFQLIVSPSTLDHFADATDLGRSLRDLHRVLADEGTLIVTLDNRQNIFDPLLRAAQRLKLIPYYLGRSYTSAQLRAELLAADYAVTATTAILHNPRLMATAVVAVANRLRWLPLTRWVQRRLIAAQRLEHSRWRYRTGSFVAARAQKRSHS